MLSVVRSLIITVKVLLGIFVYAPAAPLFLPVPQLCAIRSPNDRRLKPCPSTPSTIVFLQKPFRGDVLSCPKRKNTSMSCPFIFVFNIHEVAIKHHKLESMRTPWMGGPIKPYQGLCTTIKTNTLTVESPFGTVFDVLIARNFVLQSLWIYRSDSLGIVPPCSNLKDVWCRKGFAFRAAPREVLVCLRVLSSPEPHFRLLSVTRKSGLQQSWGGTAITPCVVFTACSKPYSDRKTRNIFLL